MRLRDTVRSWPPLGIAIVAVLLLVAVVVFMRSCYTEPAYTSWYYDLESGQTMKGGTRSPTSTAVPARVFACGECDGTAFVGYLEKSNPNPPTPSVHRPVDSAAYTLVATVPDRGTQPQWHVGTTREARTVLAAPTQRCGDVYRECLP